ncbi:MAG TPA: hypothetical protein PLQ11_01830 [Beijerinckiaceae bacterium]|nr:hypothetical protein [Beijerinckiaceae bacterium]
MRAKSYLAGILSGLGFVCSAYASDAPSPAPLTPDIGLRSYIDIAPDYSDRILDWQWDVNDKAVQPLEAIKNGQLAPGKLYVGGLVRWSYSNEHSNTLGKFPFLGQFPDQHKKQFRIGETMFNNTHLGLTLVPAHWIAGSAEVIYTDKTYPGQDNVQIRKAFISVGDLKTFPIYASFGKNSVDFGDMRSFNPFVHSMTNHYFNVHSEDAVGMVGYFRDGWHVTASAIGGGRQLRVADSPSKRGSIGNFAINGSKTFEFADGFRVKLGGGYIDNTIYNTPTPHHTSRQVAASGARVHNGAWDVNGMVSYKGFDVQTEYTSTVGRWPATDHPVSTLTVQGRYTTDLWGWQTIISAGFSRGEQGADNTRWQQMRQIVAGLEIKPHKQLSLLMEYAHLSGFVPLVAIKSVADPGVRSDVWVFGARAHF